MKDKMTLIFFSGTMDKAIAMLMLATTAASMGMEVSVFFTFWGLSFLKKGRKYKGKIMLQRMMEFFMPKRKDALPLTYLNMLGMGPLMMEKLMKRTKSPNIVELFQLAKELEVKFFACSTSCGVMGLEKDNMIDEVTDVVGAATFLKEAKEANINLFI
jgi:peroxiredoxin family protein